MKTMITMMNAMKVYSTNELVNDRDNMQKKLSQDIDAPAYEKLVSKIKGKLHLPKHVYHRTPPSPAVRRRF